MMCTRRMQVVYQRLRGTLVQTALVDISHAELLNSCEDANRYGQDVVYFSRHVKNLVLH